MHDPELSSILSQHMSPPSSHQTAPEINAAAASPRKRKRQLTSRTDSETKHSRLDGSNGVSDMYNFGGRSAQNDGATIIAPRPAPYRGPNALNPHTGAKKLVVKNLKPQAQWDSKAYLERIWKQLDNALTVIFHSKPERLSKEDLYKGCENVCRQGGASTLFSRLQERCREHMEKDILQPLQQVQSQDMLTKVLDAWKLWKEQMSTIHAIFYFMDRSYLLSSSKPTLSEYTSKLFREVVFNHEALKNVIIDNACDIITRVRTQQAEMDGELFSNAIAMFNSLAVYDSSFEPAFLRCSREYIDTWARESASSLPLHQFVAQAHELIAKDMRRCEEYELASSTKSELLASIELRIISDEAEYLTSPSALANLLDANDEPNLTSLYTLLDRRRLGSSLRPGFEKWVNETGTSIVLADNSDDMIIHLLSLQRRLDSIWRGAFQRDEALGFGLRESFGVFMNKTKKGDATWGTDNTKVGEMIAKYVDTLLRGGAKAIPENLTVRRGSSITAMPAEEDNEDEEMDEDVEMKNQLDQVLDLFRYVHGKAVFEAFYKKDLAKRLLMARSASADAERSMLARLKTECGSEFTHNLEQMFKDIELAREEMQSYKQRLEDRIGYEKGKNLDISVNILSAAAWPTYPDVAVVIPPNVKKAIDDFELHYKNKHTGRKLDWKHSLAHCQMRADFPAGKKEFVVSSFQAVVLLLFNGIPANQALSYSHIQSETGLPEAEVKRTLQSLACAKLQPLTKHPKGREINETDTFTINTNFKHPKYRVKINQVQLKETKEENKDTHMRVAEDRNFECQAAIVRIMKSRKTIGHSELVSEVIKATMSRGVLAVADIKKNIDRLIEKDYMEREDGGGYSYVA